MCLGPFFFCAFDLPKIVDASTLADNIASRKKAGDGNGQKKEDDQHVGHPDKHCSGSIHFFSMPTPAFTVRR
jgi:hypothetical protein